jgi:glycogen operon protein
MSAGDASLERFADAAQLLPGRPFPLGAHVDGCGVNFAVFSAHAHRVELCLFDAAGRRELRRLALPARSRDIFHGWLPQAGPGLVYGLRAHGPWRPDQGHRFNPAKLLLDPWAREIVGEFAWVPEHASIDPSDPQRPDPRDNAAHALKARVVDDGPILAGARRQRRAGADHRPRHEPADTVLYELHVKGFTRLHPAVPEPLRGSYAGLAHPAAIAHLRRLGVSTVSLLPVHQCLDEARLARLGLVNYWGYNTIGFFCPDPRLASPAARAAGGRAVRDEFRAMVRALHDAGIAVILDVVFNHTAESDEHGPTLSWRGLDNRSWYRLTHEQPERYVNDTGCGNTLESRHPRVLQFVMDSLRWWVGDMGVDGFRFDLATVLARGDHGFDPHAPLFRAIAQDPVLAGATLIAEPWDLGPGGYQLGGFPPGWLEWNDRFRDTMRRWWLRGHVARGEFAQRLCASGDLFHRSHRQPGDSVNYVVSHDGFTLRDLVTWERRRNHPNGESNRDGHAHNLGCNFGVEGEAAPPEVHALRARVRRALLATVLLAQGTPMLAAGDEIGHTQRGNNNPYCQDNETTWIDWSRADESLAGFVARVVAIRRAHQPLGARWYTGQPGPSGRIDLAWLAADGGPLAGDAWDRPDGRCLGALIGEPGRTPDDRMLALLLMVNGDAEDAAFTLPAGYWEPLLDSSRDDGVPRWAAPVGGQLVVPAHALVLLREHAIAAASPGAAGSSPHPPRPDRR